LDWHVACMEVMKDAYTISVSNLTGKYHLEDLGLNEKVVVERILEE